MIRNSLLPFLGRFADGGSAVDPYGLGWQTTPHVALSRGRIGPPLVMPTAPGGGGSIPGGVRDPWTLNPGAGSWRSPTPWWNGQGGPLGRVAAWRAAWQQRQGTPGMAAGGEVDFNAPGWGQGGAGTWNNQWQTWPTRLSRSNAAVSGGGSSSGGASDSAAAAPTPASGTDSADTSGASTRSSGPGTQWSTRDEMNNALFGPTGSSGQGLAGMLPSWGDLGRMAVGNALGYPGSAALAMGTLIGKDWSGQPVTARDKASAGWTLMGGPLAGAKAGAAAYAGTNYAATHPFQSYFMNGNGDPWGVNLADAGYRAGIGINALANAYDAMASRNGDRSQTARDIESSWQQISDAIARGQADPWYTAGNIGGQAANTINATNQTGTPTYPGLPMDIWSTIMAGEKQGAPWSDEVLANYGLVRDANGSIVTVDNNPANGYGGDTYLGNGVAISPGGSMVETGNAGADPMFTQPDFMGGDAASSGGDSGGGYSDPGSQAAADAMGSDFGGYWARGGRVRRQARGFADGGVPTFDDVMSRSAAELAATEASMARSNELLSRAQGVQKDSFGNDYILDESGARRYSPAVNQLLLGSGKIEPKAPAMPRRPGAARGSARRPASRPAQAGSGTSAAMALPPPPTPRPAQALPPPPAPRPTPPGMDEREATRRLNLAQLQPPGMASGGEAMEPEGKAGVAEEAGEGSPAPKGFTLGFVDTDSPGKADEHLVTVPVNSHVFPADFVSSLGDGNSLSGADRLKELFEQALQGLPKELRTPGMKPAEIKVSGGEYIASPEEITALGKGNLDAGHAIANRWIKAYQQGGHRAGV